MELQCDLGAIQSEDILRRMWQQSEDINRKKEIRSHLYKLRESRLRDLYHGDIMSGNSAPGFGKDPLNPSHGDSLVDQSFQSLKSKETRDSISPTHDLKFHSMTLNHPNTTGWDVQSSSEVSPDGRAYRTETVAKTDGVEKINGGTTEFKGRNEQRASASHQGDDKNFVKKASESSNTNLQEKVVVGDEHSGRTEMKMSSATSSSSSQVVSSSSTVQYGDETADNRYLTDSSNRPQQVRHQHQQPNQQHYLTQEQYEQQLQRQNQQQQHHHEQSRQIIDNQTTTRQQQQQQQQQQQYTEEYNRNLQESSTSRNVETQQLHEQNKRYVDMDKASPEYQQHVQNLMAQPGEIISNTVEYPKPNVKMITTVKRLPDGTIVKNKRYETEQLRPAETTRPRTTSSTSQTQNQSSTQHNTQRRERNEENIYSRQQNTRDSNTTHSKNSPRRPDVDMVDNVYDNKQELVATHPTERYVDDVTNVETKFSSVKKSSRRFSTETTSETIEEHSDYSPSGRHAPQDFSTHGFPSVKANKPTQEYPTDRPHAPHPTSDFTTQGFPSVKPNKPTQEYPSDRPRGVHSTDHQEITERYVTDSKKPSSDLAPHGFPAQIKPIMTKDGEVIVVSSEATKSSKFKTNAERIIETEVITSEGDYPSPTGQRPEKITYHTSKPQTRPEDFTTHGFPSVKGSSPARSGTPRQGTPSREHPSSPLRSQPSEDFSTHGFPSVRSPTKPAPVSPAHGFPTKHPGSTHEDVIIVSSETQKTSKQKANREHIIETEVITEDGEYSPRGGHHPQQITYTTSPRRPEDFSTHGFPSVKDSSPVRGGSPRHGTPIREHPSSPRKSQPSDDFSTHEFPSVKSPTKSSPDYSTHGFPSAKDTTRPKQYAPQPKPQPTTTTTKKSTTTTDSTQRLIHKEKEVDAAHRAFAASLRSSSPVDSPDHHQRHTPRSSISSTKTYRRDLREGSHDSTVPSETSRISSSTVTRQSPNKNVGKTVVAKQTVVKTRNVNGSNETIDLTPQRSTKSPSPSKTITTTTTRTTTTTKKAPTEVPKSDNQIIKPAENIFPINEPLTITKTHISANDASFPGNAVVEEPCIKKNYYKLGPSDKTANDIDERSPYSPAPSNHKTSTHPKHQSPVRDEHSDNYGEAIRNQPFSSSGIRPKERNQSPSKPIKPNDSSPKTISQPEESDVQRRTVLGETTIEKNEDQYAVLDEYEPESHSPKSVYPNDVQRKPTRDYPQSRQQPSSRPQSKEPKDYVEEVEFVSEKRYIPTDTRDHPKRVEPTAKPTNKSPSMKTTTTNIAKTTTHTTGKNKIRVTDDEIEVHEPVGKKPSAQKPIGKPSFSQQPQVPVGRIPDTQKPYQPSHVDSDNDDDRANRGPGPYEYEETSTRKDKIRVTDDKTKVLEPIGKRTVSEKPVGRQKSPDVDNGDGDNYPERKSSRHKYDEIITREENRVFDDEIEVLQAIGKRPGSQKPSSQSPQQPFGKKPGSQKTAKPVHESDDDDAGNHPDRKPRTHVFGETQKVDELFKNTHHVKQSKNVNEEFIAIERDNVHHKTDESPDGAFLSRSREPTPTSPTYKKKGVTQRETFEERCRQILGMEDDGDTQGTFKKRPLSELENLDEPIDAERITKTSNNEAQNTIIEVKIEDCEDDEPLYLSNIKQHIQPKGKDTKAPKTTTTSTTFVDKSDISDTDAIVNVECKRSEKYVPYKPSSPDSKRKPVTELDQVVLTSTTTKRGDKTTVKGFNKPHGKSPDDRPESEKKKPSTLEREQSPTGTRKTKKINEKETIYIEAHRSPSPEKTKPKIGGREVVCTEPRRSPSPVMRKPKTSEKDIITETRRSPSPTKSEPKITEKETIYIETRRSPSPVLNKTKTTEKEIISTTNRRSVSPTKIQPKITGKPTSSEVRHMPSSVSNKTKILEKEIVSIENRRSPSPTLPAFKKPTDDTHSEIVTEQEVYVSKKGIKCTEDSTIEKQRRSPSPVSKRTSPEKSPRQPSDSKSSPMRTSPTKSPIRKQPEAANFTTQKMAVTTTKQVSSFEPLDQPKFRTTEKTAIRNKSPNRVPTKTATKVDYVTNDTLEKRTTSATSTKSVNKIEKHTIINKEDIKQKTKPHTTPAPKTTLPKTVRKDKESFAKTTDHSTVVRPSRKPSSESPTPTTKDKLKPSTRKPKHTSASDTNSSPESSPTRSIERRRSSNISVHTEIIIDHTGPKSPKPEKKIPKVQKPHSKQPTTKESVDHPMSEKPYRKFPVTERKESAPVHSVTRKEKDAKMTRSTSEKIMKVTGKTISKPEMSSLSPTASPKVDRRPNKCFTTKTINLTTTDKILNSEDMENVIIDIQHAKSSREPSPDKIVPTPVPIDLDTGKPRYPDVVQEPEDEPRKKPIIKNIPIFEEESNAFVSCHISEINIDKSMRSMDINEEDILDNPTIEAPKSLDYPSIDKPDEDCLLSVHEKVSKFTHTAEEVKKPKASSPFNRDFDSTPNVPENDDCLLTVDEKVNKFIRTAENVTKPLSTPFRGTERPNFTEIDEELREDDCTLTVSEKVNKFINTAEKLAPTAPQKSPELVAKIERSISKQSEPEYPDDLSDAEPLTPFSQHHTTELEKKRQKDILSRPSVFETNKTVEYYTELNKDEVLDKRQSHTTLIDIQNIEDDDLTPMTKQHTTNIELRRQKDILSRPSVFEPKKPSDKVRHTRPESPMAKKPKSPSPTRKFIEAEKGEVVECEQYIDITTNKPRSTQLRKSQSPILSKKFINSEKSKAYESERQTKVTADKTKSQKVVERRSQSPKERKPQSPVPKKSIDSATIERFESDQETEISTSKTKTHSPKPITDDKPRSLEPKPLKTSSPYAPKPHEPKGYTKTVTSKVSTTRSRFESPTHDKTPTRKPLHHEPQRNVSYPTVHKRKPSTEQRKPVDKDVRDSDYPTTESDTEITASTTHHKKVEKMSPRKVETSGKLPMQGKPKKPEHTSHSPIRNGSPSTKTTITKVTQRTYKHTSPSETSDTEITETILERPSQKKASPVTVGKKNVIMDTVAARRNLFEKNLISKTQRPTTPVQSGRRPSYMDHTKSSLEHTRRDSLEVNKNNYSRKSSVEDDVNYERRPNAAVKFDVPQRPNRGPSVSEDMDIESIFDLEVLERLLETVTSYEIRRRIRAQIRLVKNNMLNTRETVDRKKSETKTSTIISSAHKSSTYSSKVHHEATDSFSDDMRTEKPRDRSYSPKRPTNVRREEIPDRSPHDRNLSPERGSKPHQEETVTVTEKKYSKLVGDRSQSPKRPLKAPVDDENFGEPKYTKVPYDRSHSPETKIISSSTKEVRRTSGTQSPTQKQYIRTEEVDYSEEITQSPRSERKTYSPRLDSSPTARHRGRSPEVQATPVSSSRGKSPDAKTKKPIREQPRNTSPQSKISKQRDDLYSTTRVTTVKNTQSPERRTSKPKTDEKTPIWADRKNVLKSPSSTTRKPTSSPTTRTSAVKTSTMKSISQRQSKNTEEDSITSSYGIGPTDENGLPLFGIRALKKKKQSPPCETNEEVTGYVIEEKYYSDNKSKPTVERKEYIYSTNADELEDIKKQVESRKQSHGDNESESGVIRRFKKIDKDYIHKEPEAITPESEEFSTSSTKYVRRGSVKEMSEKFIRKESSQSVTEKSSNYPKAGLILLTKGGTTADAGDCFESTSEKYMKTSSSSAGYRSAQQDTDEDYETGMKRSTRMVTESDSECDVKNVQRDVSKKSTTMSTRSFLNSTGESKVVTGVDDVLERMRNADYVVEEGDTAEDQEARSLLNKFLGASVIMKGVESVLPTKQTITTTTTTSYADDSDGDNLSNQAVKTTRITKTIKSGSSSSPVTRTTCDIEEIWDEEILKELLEQATTYEERRKIRARLRELMAEREEKKDLKAGEKSVSDVEEDESSSSEYEEIIEEVTDYSDAEAELEEDLKEVGTSEADKAKASAVSKESGSKQDEAATAEVAQSSSDKSTKTSPAESSADSVCDEAKSASAERGDAAQKETAADKASVDKTDTSDKGESLMPLLQDLLHKNLPQARVAANQNSNPPSKQAKQATKTLSTSTNKACTAGPIAANCSSESSNSCTVRDNYTNSHSHTKTNTHQPTKTKTNNNTTNNNNNNNNSNNTKQSQKPPQKTMTKDGVTTAKATSVSGSDSSARRVDRLSVPQKEDSGTESGEDLRLIAAGLRDKLQLQSDTNLIQEVTAALSRLESSLKEGKEIPVDGSKREALLALVARLQTGLTSPDKLAEAPMAGCEVDGGGVNYDETSSPEADAHRSNRARFARRRNRNSRHTVGVSREELADARRYMEDMILMENISSCTTPDASTNPVTPPQLFPIEKNASSGAILTHAQSTLYRPNQFVPSSIKQSTECLDSEQHTSQTKEVSNNIRPFSGNYSVNFEQQYTNASNNAPANQLKQMLTEVERDSRNTSPDSITKSNRFSAKKQLMKRANTIDIPKSKKYNPDFDSDSENEGRGPIFGLKRTVQVSVKHKARNVIPPFEPKTENDHKFLAFINKQSAKPGLGWANSRSVSNWTNKFGNLKHTFEVGVAASTTTGKPPQVPGHVPHNAAKNYWNKQVSQYPDLGQPQSSNAQQQTQRNQFEAAERQRKLERERFERERIERDRLERQRQERERLERDRLEREFYEREQMERERLAAAQHAAMPSMSVPKPAPVNQFIHAPQSVFRPIDNSDSHTHNIFKPIPQLPSKVNIWQPPSSLNIPLSAPAQMSAQSPQFFMPKQPKNTSHVTSPSSTTSSPVGLPWVSKPAVDNSDFRKKANTFEERSQNDNRANSYLQRHNSLRSPRANQQLVEEYRKRPSLPNAADPFLAPQSQYAPQQAYAPAIDTYPPPPINMSFKYSDYNRKGNFKSQPCLPSAVESEYTRKREDSLTDPHLMPLVLTTSNPSYGTEPDSLQPYVNAPPKQFDYISPMDSAPTSPSIMTLAQTDYTDDDLDSEMLEYRVESKVMGKPQSQTAVTVGSRTAHVSDDEVFGKNSRAARNLLHTMKNLGGSNNGLQQKREAPKKPSAPTSPNVCLSPDGRAYQAPVVEPLFPQLTNFEPNRSPQYINQNSTQPPAPKYSKPRTYTPPMPKHTDRSFQLSKYDKPHREQMPYTKSNTAPYISETQPAYVVTYPLEDQQENIYQKQHPISLPLQRNRNISENSTTSSTLSISQNLPSPGTNWTANPVHVDDYQVAPPRKHSANREDHSLSHSGHHYEYPQTQPRPFAANTVQPDVQPMPVNFPASQKPDVAPKPHGPPHNVKTQQYTPPPPQIHQEPPPPQQQPQQTQLQQTASAAHYQLSPASVQKPIGTERSTQPKRSPAISVSRQSQSLDIKQYESQSQKSSFIRQGAMDAGMGSLQTQNRVLSQQSLVSKKQQQFQQQKEQQLTELRRKSLGNALEMQQQQRKTAYLSETQNLIKQEYKSSAPADTPDIVKSSLPKEDGPILKKFGPPQRHHYVPNSYQSPGSNTQSKKFESSSKVTRSEQHEIVQHSTMTTKPSIVEIPVTPQPAEDLIPRNIVFNNVSAFSSMSRRRDDDERAPEQQPRQPNRLSKSDSWNQIVQMQSQANAQLPPVSPKFGSSGNELRRTKSGHSLNVRMYEAGIDKAVVNEKQRTVEAYFTGKKSPNQLTNEVESRMMASSKKSAINRTKTSEKVSTSQQQQSTATTEKTETKEEDGAVVTTTTKVTTRTITGTGTAPKPVSPFAKFKQLDKQNSLQSQKSPSTPTTPGGSAASPSGSARIFHFTDPALNARAATVKDQLLQWCQFKTQEYENVQITNFSTSWSDGLAFCALIHHFLPDAFDYSKLTPQSRRHNFELAFTVADEKAGIAPLLDVEDMVEMKRPDWKCVFVYVQSIYRRFRNCQ